MQTQTFRYNPGHIYGYSRAHQYALWLMETYPSARILGFFLAWIIMLAPVVALLTIFSPVVQDCLMRVLLLRGMG